MARLARGLAFVLACAAGAVVLATALPAEAKQKGGDDNCAAKHEQAGCKLPAGAIFAQKSGDATGDYIAGKGASANLTREDCTRGLEQGEGEDEPPGTLVEERFDVEVVAASAKRLKVGKSKSFAAKAGFPDLGPGGPKVSTTLKVTISSAGKATLTGKVPAINIVTEGVPRQCPPSNVKLSLKRL